jgi:cytoskeletal protein CcmA (bactofilin family)
MVGARMKVTGTIVSDEDLEIVGQVEGEIRARETLSIAKDAEVRAVVHGRRVVLEGALHGDIHASELVVLGNSSTMQGDIHTPTLEIREGALFRGSVKMKAAQQREERSAPAGDKSTARSSSPKPAATKPSKQASDGSAAEGDGQQKLPATSPAG